MKSLLALLAGSAIAAGIATPVAAAPVPPPDPVSARKVAVQDVRPAEPVGQGTGRVRTLVLTVSRGENADLPDRYALLDCDPVGGSHPAAKEACAALEKVHGDPAALRQREGTTCPMVYDPVTVTAHGVWDGRYSWYRRTFGNRCQLESLEGPLFAI